MCQNVLQRDITANHTELPTANATTINRIPVNCQVIVTMEVAREESPTIASLISQRVMARHSNDYGLADELREVLWDEHGVVIDDDDDTWSHEPSECTEDGCMVWIRGKQVDERLRTGAHCGAPRASGSRYYCSEHVREERGRVPCPRGGSTHTVLLTRLNSHLKVYSSGGTLTPNPNPNPISPCSRSALVVSLAIVMMAGLQRRTRPISRRISIVRQW